MTVRDFLYSLTNLGSKFSEFISEVFRVVFFEDNVLDAPLLVGIFAAGIWLCGIVSVFAVAGYLWNDILEKPVATVKRHLFTPIIRAYKGCFSVNDEELKSASRWVSVAYKTLQMLQMIFQLGQYFVVVSLVLMLVLFSLSDDLSFSNAKLDGVLLLGLILFAPFLLAFLNKIVATNLLKRHRNR